MLSRSVSDAISGENFARNMRVCRKPPDFRRWAAVKCWLLHDADMGQQVFLDKGDALAATLQQHPGPLFSRYLCHSCGID
eukprot:61269-Rhodomonas_salina.4